MQRTHKLRYYTFVLLLAFVLNATLPFFAVHNPPGGLTEKNSLASVFGEKILICTAEGFKWVKWADLQSGKEKPKPHSGDKCPLCSVARNGLQAILGEPAIILPDHNRIRTFVLAYDFLPASLHLASPLNVRAPPVSFIS